MAELRELQQWMQATLIDPAGGASDDEIARTVRATPGLGARARIDLYRRGYRSRLVECMRASYPALRHALGDELFDEFAGEYVDQNPSRSHTLLDLGAGFADHLAATRPEGETWPFFLIDLARLERLFVEVYEGHGAEGEQLASTPAADAACAIAVEPVPCLRLMRARYPVGPYLLAVRRGEQPELPAQEPSWLALCRRDYTVTLTRLDEAGFHQLSALVAGEEVEVEPSRQHAWAAGGFVRTIRVATRTAEEALR